MIDRDGKIILVDGRAEEDYAVDHLPGAVSLLRADVKRTAPEKIRKGVPVVVYSNDADCPASGLVAGELAAMGYGPVYDYKGSYRDWVSRGYPLEKGG
jgi:rhodanese-related sulfurtransferase